MWEMIRVACGDNVRYIGEWWEVLWWTTIVIFGGARENRMMGGGGERDEMEDTSLGFKVVVMLRYIIKE